MFKVRAIWAYGFALCAMVSCSKVEDIDTELENQLSEASDGYGVTFFMQPESYDYNSIPQDPKNPLTSQKVNLGRSLYHETGLALDPFDPVCLNTYSCATCHSAVAGFQAGRQQGLGDGGFGFGRSGEARENIASYPVDSLDVQPIRTPSALNMAYQPNLLWNGQFGATYLNEGTEAQWTAGTPKATNYLGYEGLETQAIAGIQVHRMLIDTAFIFSTPYKSLFDAAFPEVPEIHRYTREYAGLAIAAYERTLLANQSPFQKWLRGDYSAMTSTQKSGALLFFGKAECSKCHSGPALSSMEFFALGMPDLEGPGVYGADATKAENKGRGGFTQVEADMYKFKVPQLYNLKDSPFYGHGGTFTSVRSVLEYKNNAVSTNTSVPESQLSPDFKPLNLSDEEMDQLVEFIENALYDPNLERYEPSRLPSGLCFPNNDPESIIDLGCG